MNNNYLSHFRRKPVYVLCKQQRRSSACASAQSDQRLYCLLPTLYNTSSFYTRNFKPLASLCSWAGQFESYLVRNPKVRFSCDMAHLIGYLYKFSEYCKFTITHKKFVFADVANLITRKFKVTAKYLYIPIPNLVQISTSICTYSVLLCLLDLLHMQGLFRNIFGC